MNAGLTNLTTLKSWLLPQSMRAQSTWDEVLVMIGRGVLAAMENYCGRRFGRVEQAVEKFQAGVEWVWLSRCPVEVVHQVEMRAAGAGEWQVMDEVVEQVNESSGWLKFVGQLGGENDMVRVVYTGGYWIDETEDGSGVKPEGAVAAPADLVWAWGLQCEHVWSRRDKLGAGLAQGAGKSADLGEMELVPLVKTALEPYRRLAMM